MSDGSGLVDLNGIHLNADGSVKWNIYDDVSYFTYHFNPCVGFEQKYVDYDDTVVWDYKDLSVSLLILIKIC